MPDSKRPIFQLRLPKSVREQAEVFAAEDEISLNHFIGIAVAERIVRLQAKPDRRNAEGTQITCEDQAGLSNGDAGGEDAAAHEGSEIPQRPAG